MKNSLLIADEATMLDLGAHIAACISKKAIIHLEGPLGAGKTTLVRGFLQALGHQGRVKSPTYTLVESYHLQSCIVHHFDLYRLKSSQELEEMGMRDYLAETAITLIEWPEKAEGVLPKPDLICAIQIVPKGRIVSLIASTEDGLDILGRLPNTTDQ